MKTKSFLYLMTVLLLSGCNDNMDNTEYIICPPDKNIVMVFTVDYTTNDFLGGYTIELPEHISSLELACIYDSPSDFGNVSWYDKSTETELFSGTIIWMGKGQRTYPNEIIPAVDFVKLSIETEMPQFNLIYHQDYDEEENSMNYDAIWKSLRNLQAVSWADSSTSAYIYLYTPSVGRGDPKDWHWIIFFSY